MGERDGSSSPLIPWHPLYRDFRYTVVFGMRGCSLYRDIRHTLVFFIPWCSCAVVFFIPGCSLYCCIRYSGVFVIMQYSLYRVVTHTDDSCYHGVRYIQGLHCI